MTIIDDPQSTPDVSSAQPVPPTSHGQRNLIIALLIVAMLAVIGLAFGMSSGGDAPGVSSPGASATGFNDPDTLAADMESEINAKQTDGSTVSITCIPDSAPHKFMCHGEWSDDTPAQSVPVTVSPDGKTWIS